MRLEEIAAQHLRSSSRAIPDWTQGCFRRRTITFYTGATDEKTEVWWLQAGGLSADLRIHPEATRLQGRSIADCSPEEFQKLCRSEGGVAKTTWNRGMMSWSDWSSFQLHDKWVEPAQLRRIGNSIIEFAPSGAYLEDWRMQPSTPGPLIGLRLADERDYATNQIIHRGGGLIICGDHAALVLGRPRHLQTGAARLADLAAAYADDLDFRSRVFSCEASYAKREGPGKPYRILLSTNPSLVGEELFQDSGFTVDASTGDVLQDFESGSSRLLRRFRIDTLLPEYKFQVETSVTPAGMNWLEKESDTLLSFASPWWGAAEKPTFSLASVVD